MADDLHVVTEDEKEFLDDLRDSGITNMFGAVPYLMDEFDMDKGEAKSTLSAWMRGYSL